MKLTVKAIEMARKQIFKQCVQSVDKIFLLNQFVSMPPWLTENVVVLPFLSNEQWKNISDLVFPTLDSTFLKVNIVW